MDQNICGRQIVGYFQKFADQYLNIPLHCQMKIPQNSLDITYKPIIFGNFVIYLSPVGLGRWEGLRSCRYWNTVFISMLHGLCHYISIQSIYTIPNSYTRSMRQQTTLPSCWTKNKQSGFLYRLINTSTLKVCL